MYLMVLYIEMKMMVIIHDDLGLMKVIKVILMSILIRLLDRANLLVRKMEKFQSQKVSLDHNVIWRKILLHLIIIIIPL